MRAGRFREDQFMRNKPKLDFGKVKYNLPVKHLRGDIIGKFLILVLESKERARLAKFESHQHT